MSPGALARSVALAVLLVSPGCSWIAVRPPPDRVAPGETPDCTTTREAPIADASLAAFMLANDVFLATGPSLGSRSPLAYAAMSAGAGLAVYLALSAWYGFRQTGRCRSLIDAPLVRDPGGSDHH